jgi:uncharacterized membrane protein YqiK
MIEFKEHKAEANVAATKAEAEATETMKKTANDIVWKICEQIYDEVMQG